LDAGYALYFGYEEGFGGSDSGGNDYGYLIYDNNNSTYGSAGGETSTLRIGTQNDGDGAVGDHVAIEAAANIYLRPGAWGGGGSLRVGTLASYTTVVTSGNYNTYAPTLTGGGASGTWGISISGNAATATSTDNINGRAFLNRDSGNALAQDSYTTNGVGYVNSVSLFSQTDGGMYASAYSTAWVHQIYGDFRTGQIAVRGKNSGTWLLRSTTDRRNRFRRHDV
jgi:hypothetical protein